MEVLEDVVFDEAVGGKKFVMKVIWNILKYGYLLPHETLAKLWKDICLSKLRTIDILYPISYFKPSLELLDFRKFFSWLKRDISYSLTNTDLVTQVNVMSEYSVAVVVEGKEAWNSGFMPRSSLIVKIVTDLYPNDVLEYMLKRLHRMEEVLKLEQIQVAR